MKVYELKRVSTLKNGGQRAQQDADLYFTNQMRKPDHIRFDVESDIPELRMSVKSNGFSLVSGGILKGETKEEMINDYFERVASECFLYVATNYKAYLMNAKEFKEFVTEFGYIDNESAKNGTKQKIRVLKESKRLMAYLER